MTSESNPLSINIGLFGCVSVGKSTLINALAAEPYSDTDIRRTTMVPQVYTLGNVETPGIRQLNRQSNTSPQEFRPLYHKINRLDIFDSLHESIALNIYDIPGLNDPDSKSLYFSWVKQNCRIFDIIIFITDINRGLNNADEIDVLQLLFHSKNASSRMICLMNKCDDIYYDADVDDMIFQQLDQQNIFVDANNVLNELARKHNCNQDVYTAFIPISAENCYIHRRLQAKAELDFAYKSKLCRDHIGLAQWKTLDSHQIHQMYTELPLMESNAKQIMDSGYHLIVQVLQEVCDNNAFTFITNKIHLKLLELHQFTLTDVAAYINSVRTQYEFLTAASAILDTTSSLDIFWRIFKKTIKNYAVSICKTNNKIFRKSLIEFNEFETMHSEWQTHCINFKLIETAAMSLRSYPTDFMTKTYTDITKRFMEIYEQISTITDLSAPHVSANNLLCYLQVIATYSPENLDRYANEFTKFILDTESAEVLAIIRFIARTNNRKLVAPIGQILINKQKRIYNNAPDSYFNYLIIMKKLVNSIIAKLPVTSYSALDVVAEVTDKNITSCLVNRSISSIYRAEIDYSKASALIQLVPDATQNYVFEKELLDICLRLLII